MKESLFAQSNEDMINDVLWTMEDHKTLERETFGAAVMDNGCRMFVVRNGWSPT